MIIAWVVRIMHVHLCAFVPDCIGSGCVGHTTGVALGAPKSDGSLTSMIFLTPDHQGFGGFLFNKNKKGNRKMKKSSLLIIPSIMMGILTIPNTAFGLVTVCRQMACMPSDSSIEVRGINCATSTATCWGSDTDKTGVESCMTCESGYTKVSKSTVLNCGGSTLNASYNTCLLTCTTSNCKSDTSWSSYGTGYQRKANRSCSDSTTCKTTYSYRCAAGYYGSSSNGTSGCSPCPSGGTSSAGTTSATGCYIPSGTTGSDSTGTYKYTSNCYWKN